MTDSTVAPITQKDWNIIHAIAFYDSDLLVEQLSNLQNAAFNNNQVKREILGQIQANKYKCVDAFDFYFRRRNIKDQSKMDDFYAGTVVCSLDLDLSPYFSQLDGLTQGKSTGKQSSVVAKRETNHDTEGDVTINNDAILAFVQLIPSFIQKLVNSKAITEAIQRFGYEYKEKPKAHAINTHGKRIKRENFFFRSSSPVYSTHSSDNDDDDLQTSTS